MRYTPSTIFFLQEERYMRDSLLPGYIMLATALTVAVVSTGCSKKKQPQTEPETTGVISVENVITDPETEVVETEPETGKKDPPRTKETALASFTKPGSVFGTVGYSIRGNRSTDGNEGYVVTADDVFMMKNTNGVVDIYVSDEEGYVLGSSGWIQPEKEGGSLLMFNPSAEGVYYKGTQDNDGIKTDVLESVTEGGAPAAVMAILEKDGRTDINPIRTTVNWALTDGIMNAVYFNVEFMDAEGGGSMTVKFNIDGPDNGGIAPPDIAKIKEVMSYTGGSVQDGYYVNDSFRVRIRENDPLVFDSAKTEEMNASYAGAGLFYVSDAYASCDGGILNITYIPSDGRGETEILNGYLADCLAENIGVTSQGELGGGDAIYADAVINGTKARTYCMDSGYGALVFCIYYKEEKTRDDIVSSFLRFDADPDWKEETKQIGNYLVTTPDQYTVDGAISSDLYTCFIAPDGSEMNIFVMDGTIDKVRETDTAGSEVMKQETVKSDSGREAQYLEIKGSQEGVDYVAYELLWQGDPDHVLKYTVFSRNEDENYLNDFLDALDLTVMTEIESETEISSPDGETPPA